MNPQDVIRLLEQVSEMLTPTAERVWTIYYRQVVSGTWVALIACLIFAVVGVPCSWSGWKIYKVREYPSGDDGFNLMVFGIILVVVACIILPMGVMELLNPEYYTIRSILKSLQQ